MFPASIPTVTDDRARTQSSDGEQMASIRLNWADAADAARLTREERSGLWGRQVLNDYALEDY